MTTSAVPFRRCATMAGALATVALLTSSPTAQAATVLTIEPLNLGQGPLIDTQLGGALCAAPNTCTSVQYPASLSLTSIPDGASVLNSLIGTAVNPVVVFGYSEGAQVAATWMAQYGSGSAAPAAHDVSFVLIGNPNRAYGGASNELAKMLNIATPPDTQYQVTDVAREYDFWADLPTGRLNSIALVNAIAGSLFIHTDYTKVDLADPNNVTWKEGNITYVLVPTETLPMFLPLQWAGLDSLADSLSAEYRPIVDSAYDRPVPVPAPNTNTTAASDPAAAVTPATTAVTPPPNKTLTPVRPAAMGAAKAVASPAPMKRPDAIISRGSADTCSDAASPSVQQSTKAPSSRARNSAHATRSASDPSPR